MAAGFVVGCFWWMFHRASFVDFYWTLVYPFKELGLTFREFDIVYELLNLEFAFAQALTVGLVVGLFSRDKPYLITSLAIAATFAAKFFVFDFSDTMTMGLSEPRSVSEIQGGMICYAVVYLTIPMLGTYLAQKLVQWAQKRKANAE